jgi:hypothetical protein
MTDDLDRAQVAEEAERESGIARARARGRVLPFTGVTRARLCGRCGVEIEAGAKLCGPCAIRAERGR